ncbi:MAG TPA: GNAT family N-acetyltransferase [Flexilinea sp.]|jgi:ribosomal-protein-alanine N-acetyltransferase|nr:GNAT family N-acetyltransferase [Flexilinea sp.]HNY20467.1 GNAT family N-acetyltransferase [Flexilinea sp.]HOW07374.1 GNAT family N-acetyltransferase [Flexilinea sp.]HPS48442.1 GNAT family N-acetyltransferase [Flexilinea sp.]
MYSDKLALFPKTILTQRLQLRPITRADENDIFEYASNPEVARYMSWSAHRTLADTEEFLKYIDQVESEKLQIDRGIVWRENNKMVGTIAFVSIDLALRVVELGYCLSNQYWGRGIIVEAANAMIDAAVRTLDIHRIEAECEIDNFKSERVMQKLGMEQEGVMRKRLPVHGVYRDAKLYAKVVG